MLENKKKKRVKYLLNNEIIYLLLEKLFKNENEINKYYSILDEICKKNNFEMLSYDIIDLLNIFL